MRFSAASYLLLSLMPMSAGAETPDALKLFSQRMPDYYNVSISPNGEYLALQWPNGEQVALGVMTLKDLKVIASVEFGQGQDIGQYAWVGPDRLVMSVIQNEGTNKGSDYGELYGMNANGSAKGYLFGYRGKMSTGTHISGGTAQSASARLLDPLPYEPGAAVIGVLPWVNVEMRNIVLNRMDTLSGATSRIGNLSAYGLNGIKFDRAGLPRLAVVLDEHGYNQILVAEGKEHEWQPISVAKSVLDAAAFSADPAGQHVYFSSDEGQDKACLRQYDFSAKAQKILSCNDDVDIEDVSLAFDGSELPIATYYADGLPTTVYLDPSSPDAVLLKRLENTFEGNQVRVISRTLDGQKLIFLVSSDRNPGDYYLYDRTTRKAEALFPSRNAVDPQKMRAMSAVQYKSRDGRNISGYLTLPAVGGKKLPMIVMPHGGPWLRDYWGWNAEVQYFASQGYAVLQPNFRGSTGYGREFLRAGFGQWATGMIDDITDGVRWSIEQGIADPGRICIYGASYGGFAAITSVEREPDLYRCAISVAGVYQLDTLIQQNDVGRSRIAREVWEERTGEDKAVLTEQSPVNHVDKLKVPLLIIHGNVDDRVPIAQARALRKALDKAGKHYEWIELPHVAHAVLKDEDEAAVLTSISKFLRSEMPIPMVDAASADGAAIAK